MTDRPDDRTQPISTEATSEQPPVDAGAPVADAAQPPADAGQPAWVPPRCRAGRRPRLGERCPRG